MQRKSKYLSRLHKPTRPLATANHSNWQHSSCIDNQIVLLHLGNLRRASGTRAATGADGDAAVCSKLERVGGRVAGIGINTDDDPLEKTLAEGVAKVDVAVWVSSLYTRFEMIGYSLENRVGSCAGSLLLAEDAVLGVSSQCRGVGVVGAKFLDGVREVLVPEELTFWEHVRQSSRPVAF